MNEVLIYEPIDFSPNVIRKLQERGFKVKTNDENLGLKHAFENYDVIYMRLSEIVNSEFLEGLPYIKCKFLIIPATGIDHIDEVGCRERGISVMSFKRSKHLLKDIRATAELTLGLTFTLLRHIPWAIKDAAEGNWNRDDYRGRDVFGKKVGVIGYGRLGRIVGNYFNTLGAEVYVYDVNSCIELEPYVERKDTLCQIFQTCDVITLHVDYSIENINLIGKTEFESCVHKPIFINTSRGQLVNESALLYALENNFISAAALDVVSNEEQYNSNNKLAVYAREHRNLILTPHIGGCTLDSSHKTEEIITDEFLILSK